MTSKEMIAHFHEDYISQLKLMKMATTLYHVVDDSLLAGENTVSGDTIRISFQEGEIKRFSAIVRIDTTKEWEYFSHGCILQYVMRQLMS